MKFLHTSDLHIGKKLNKKSLLEDQAYILQEILKVIDKENIDAVVLAGDLYDTSNPSKEAINLIQEFFREINIKRGKAIFAISGNHDSKERVAVGKEWYSQTKLYVATEIEESFEKIEFLDANIYLMPYFEIGKAREYFDDRKIETVNEGIKRVVDKIYEDLDETKLNILVGHTFVAGSKVTDSERNLSVGTIENVDKDIFSKFDYVALGHLHNPKAHSSNRVKYSGSPYYYSFSEAGQTKGVRIIDIEKDEFLEKFVPIEPQKHLKVIEATYEDLIDPKFYEDIKRDDYFKFILDGAENEIDLMGKLSQIYPNILSIEHKGYGVDFSKEITEEEIKKLNPLELIEKFYEEIKKEELDISQKELSENILYSLIENKE